MRKMIKITLVAIVMILAIAGTAFAGQLDLQKFTVTPSPFKKGQTLNLSVQIQNPNPSQVSGSYSIYLYVNDGTPERTGPGAFLGQTALPTIAANSTATVNLAQTYTVPNNASNQIVFSIHLPSIVPGVEFGPAYQYKYNASCTYSPEIRLIPLGVISRPPVR